jgi:PhnB protein
MPVDPIPAGHAHLIPHLVCSPCAEAIEFYKRAFGAREVRRLMSPDGRKVMHAAMLIGDSFFFLADDFPEFCGGRSRSPRALGATPVTIHRYVQDCDAAMKQAIEAGAKVVMPASDTFWGDRYGVIDDPFGHQWSLATHLRDMTPQEMQKAMLEAFGAGPKS